MRKSRFLLLGTQSNDVLTGTPVKRFVYGRAGDDIIGTEDGLYRVWGQGGMDSYVTLSGTPGHMKIMDMEIGETIQFCGCSSTAIEQRGKDAWIVQGDDVKAVVVGTKASSLDIDYSAALITLMSDPVM